MAFHVGFGIDKPVPIDGENVAPGASTPGDAGATACRITNLRRLEALAHCQARQAMGKSSASVSYIDPGCRLR
jgi:hypothetical protein